MVWEDGMDFWTFRDSPHDRLDVDKTKTNREPDAYISAVRRYEIARRAKKKGMTVKKYRKFLKRRRERRKMIERQAEQLEIQRREPRAMGEDDSDAYDTDEWEDSLPGVPPVVEQVVEPVRSPELMYWSTGSSSDDSDDSEISL